jgi:hypothetical protein
MMAPGNYSALAAHMFTPQAEMNLLVIADDESVGSQIPDCTVDVLVSLAPSQRRPKSNVT